MIKATDIRELYDFVGYLQEHEDTITAYVQRCEEMSNIRELSFAHFNDGIEISGNTFNHLVFVATENEDDFDALAFSRMMGEIGIELAPSWVNERIKGVFEIPIIGFKFVKTTYSRSYFTPYLSGVLGEIEQAAKDTRDAVISPVLVEAICSDIANEQFQVDYTEADFIDEQKIYTSDSVYNENY